MAFVVESCCQLVGRGSFPGQMYFIRQEYPGGIYDEKAESKVYGQIFSIDPEDYERVMRLLDQYEGFSEQQPESSLFQRSIIPIDTNGQQVPCWVYLYNQDPKEAPLVENGNYWQFLKDQNLHKKQ